MIPQPGTTPEELAQRTCCAHLRISWRTVVEDGGLTTGWWECDSNCGAKFWPIAARPASPAAPVSPCGEIKWDKDNTFNREPHRCRFPKGHAGNHKCGENNGTGDGCSFSWGHSHECRHGHPHDGRCECVCGYEALSASKAGGPENWHLAAAPPEAPMGKIARMVAATSPPVSPTLQGGTRMKCPSCPHGELVRLLQSSEPEEIRKDAECPLCGNLFMVTKGGLVKLPHPAATHPDYEKLLDELIEIAPLAKIDSVTLNRYGEKLAAARAALTEYEAKLREERDEAIRLLGLTDGYMAWFGAEAETLERLRRTADSVRGEEK